MNRLEVALAWFLKALAYGAAALLCAVVSGVTLSGDTVDYIPGSLLLFAVVGWQRDHYRAAVLKAVLTSSLKREARRSRRPVVTVRSSTRARS